MILLLWCREVKACPMAGDCETLVGLQFAYTENPHLDWGFSFGWLRTYYILLTYVLLAPRSLYDCSSFLFFATRLRVDRL